MAKTTIPLVVDLDGTLIKSDTLHEMVAHFVKNHFWKTFSLIVAVFKGPSEFKHFVAQHAALDYARLPMNREVEELIAKAREDKRRVVLATAATESVALEAAHALGPFDEVLASTRSHNLKGPKKARALVEKFGPKGFDYVGDSRADFPVFEQARTAYLVSSSTGDIRMVQRLVAEATVVRVPTAKLRGLFRLLRPHQWSKNLLLFVPLIAAQQFEAPSLASLMIAFVAFSAVSSAVYVVNDVFDVQEDRQHPHKKARPIAAGVIGLPTAAITVVTLLAVAALLSVFFLEPVFLAVLSGYALVTTVYSTSWKQIVLLDVFILTGLYGVRLVAGSVVTSVGLSPWLVAFSFFAFLSLALAKRYAEIVAPDFRGTANGRGYHVSDREVVLGLGVGSGLISALVLALYVDSDAVVALYSHPILLLVTVPFWTLWISRVWLLAQRNRLHSDPVLFALRDRVSYLVGAIALVAVVLAR